MPYAPHYRPFPRWFTLEGGLEDVVRPAAFPKRILRFRNDRAAAALGLEALGDAEWEAAFARFEPLLCNLREPLALRYHGHQFGVYNPALGDGRGFLFAQLRERGTGRLIDLGTKGSGQTPWSRGGDGRLTLKGGVREVLATEMLESMGVPTSRTLSLFETGEALLRSDEPSPTRSSVLVRAQESHVRFGTFQRLAHHGDVARARRLVRYSAEHYFPALDRGASDAALAEALFAEVVARTARLAAWWMAAGFVHGVLNTDNFVITGESFDYGPWRFLPTCDRGFVAAYFDPGGRYAYGRQPEVARWNLERLADALASIADRDALERRLAAYDAAFGRELAAAVAARLGLEGPPEARARLAEATFAFLESSRAPFEQVFYDGYGGFDRERLARSPARDAYAGRDFEDLERAAARLGPTAPARAAHASPALAGASPETMLIDEVEAIWAAIDARDDWAPFERKIAAIRARARG